MIDAGALAVALADVRVAIARTGFERAECFRVRHLVYCAERGFFPAGDAAEETDAYDDRALHGLVRLGGGEPVGTVRLVRPDPLARPSRLPMHDAVRVGLLRHLPPDATGEVSRFAVSKTRRGAAPHATLIRLALVRGVVLMAREAGVTHLCALMAPALLRLLASHAIRFHPVGPPVRHHGVRQPCAGSLAGLLARVEKGCPPLWHYLTAPEET